MSENKVDEHDLDQGCSQASGLPKETIGKGVNLEGNVALQQKSPTEKQELPIKKTGSEEISLKKKTSSNHGEAEASSLLASILPREEQGRCEDTDAPDTGAREEPEGGEGSQRALAAPKEQNAGDSVRDRVAKFTEDVGRKGSTSSTGTSLWPLRDQPHFQGGKQLPETGKQDVLAVRETGEGDLVGQHHAETTMSKKSNEEVHSEEETQEQATGENEPLRIHGNPDQFRVPDATAMDRESLRDAGILDSSSEGTMTPRDEVKEGPMPVTQVDR